MKAIASDDWKLKAAAIKNSNAIVEILNKRLNDHEWIVREAFSTLKQLKRC